MGRCGTKFTCTQEDIEPDIITIAKGLGAGYQPIGATLLSKQINDAIEVGSEYFQHGHTYLSHPMVCAAAMAVQQEIDTHQLLDNVNIQGTALKQSLKTVFNNHPHIGDIRGRGLFIGIEFVEDKHSKKPFPSDFALHAHLKKAAMDEGLMIYPGYGTLDGRQGHHVLMAPPFIIEAQHINEIVEKFTKALDQTLTKQ
jgi:adenosylmethionine-8-amino-7-oxononanoate aminotransferase